MAKKKAVKEENYFDEVSNHTKEEALPDASIHPLAHAIPRDDRVIVRREKPSSTTRGGILLANACKKPTGIVHRVGPGKRDANGIRVPSDLKVGDRVLMTDYAGLEIRDPMAARATDEEYVILREDDIIAVLPS